MHKVVHLRRYNLLSFKNVVLIIVIMLMFSVYYLFSFINKKVTPILMDYAVSRTTQLATLVITQAIDREVFANTEINDLFEIDMFDNNYVKTVDFNSVKINKVLNMITNSVEEYIGELESGNINKIEMSKKIADNYKYDSLKKGIIYEIPSGVVFKNSLLSNLGPRVPVRLNMVGDVETNVDTSVTGYGINNALLKIIVTVSVNLKVLLPFSSKVVTVSSDIPLAMKLITGEVPSYFYPSLSS